MATMGLSLALLLIPSSLDAFFVSRQYSTTTRTSLHRPLRMQHQSLTFNNSDGDNNHESETNTSLYAPASPGPTREIPSSIVRWNDLLEATVPLACEDEDEPCLLLQRESLESLYAQHDTITKTDIAAMAVFGTAMITAFVGLVHLSGPGGWKYYLAGGLCAALSHVIPVPIDVVKTRKQVDPALASQSFPEAFRYILENEGVDGLLSGLGPTAVGYLLEGAIKFGVYEVMKTVVAVRLARLAALSSYLAFMNSKVIAFALSAAVSGLAASIMLCPMEALRIRMVANPEKRSRGWMVTLYKMLKNEGVSSLTKSMTPMVLKQVPYTVTKNVSFDFITKLSYTALLSRGSIIGPASKMVVPFTAAAAASVLSCVTSQPGDMILSLMNAHKNDVRRTRDIVHDIVKSERGISGLFIGLKTRFLHVGIIVTLQLLIYDIVKRMCGIAATGISH